MASLSMAVYTSSAVLGWAWLVPAASARVVIITVLCKSCKNCGLIFMLIVVSCWVITQCHIAVIHLPGSSQRLLHQPVTKACFNQHFCNSFRLHYVLCILLTIYTLFN